MLTAPRFVEGHRLGTFTPGGSWLTVMGNTTYGTGGIIVHLSSMTLEQSGDVTATGTISSSTEWATFAVEVV